MFLLTIVYFFNIILGYCSKTLAHKTKNVTKQGCIFDDFEHVNTGWEMAAQT